MKKLAERREHYYYVMRGSGIEVIKSFNRKDLLKQTGYKLSDISGRYRHYGEAYKFACALASALDYSSPSYRSVTGSDFID